MPPTRITGIFTAFFIALEYSLKYASLVGELIANLMAIPLVLLSPPLTSIAQTPAFSKTFAVSIACEISLSDLSSGI